MNIEVRETEPGVWSVGQVIDGRFRIIRRKYMALTGGMLLSFTDEEAAHVHRGKIITNPDLIIPDAPTAQP